LKAEFPGGTTLGDDSVKHTIVLERIGGVSVEQVSTLFGGANVLRIAAGNVGGECVFTAAKSHATLDAALTFFKAEFARLNGTHSLVLTQGAVTLTMANAVCKAVEVVLVIGLRWSIRYTFGITTIT
jgi:hypothetical protein